MSSTKEDEQQLVPAARATTASSHRGGDGGSQPGGSAHVDIYVRIRPVPKASSRVVVEHSENKLEFNIPRDANQGYVNNQRENYNFRFNGIIGPEAKQDEVFERIARNLVVGALDGFNGTIFAYGQTGSGKTFTITGGAMHYADRGIIPRTLSSIFSEVTKRTDHQYQVHVSYLEIYNQTGFDLLDPNREIKAMEDLPQVFVMEDEEQRTSFRNLSIHRANNEEEALNLLFLGDTNRTISETPMNQASSRSHCIFTIHVEARKAGEDIMRRSKLNLVDLAGSERASKTGIDGTTLKEAKYINLSLHYLEQVIIALQERSMGINRPHIPYRNSMMTMVLKDSLGGNCRTVMVANINPDQSQLDESISTCRFAMRVALVRNQVMLNEEVDPNLIIRRLKQEIRDLREEMRLVKGETEDRGPLTPDEIKRLSEQVEAYCADNSPEATLNLGGSMLYIRAAFDSFRKLVRAGGVVGPAGVSQKLLSGGGDRGTAAGPDMAEQLRKLRLQVQQRDNEINILVGMLKRRDAASGGGGAAAGPAGGMMMGGGLPALASAPNRPPLGAPPAAGVPMAGAGSNGVRGGAAAGGLGQQVGANGGGASVGSSLAGSPKVGAGSAGPYGQTQVGQGWSAPSNESPGGSPSSSGAAAAAAAADPMSQLFNANLLADRNKAFELFRKSYRQNEVIEDNKALLKQKYDAAKAIGASVNGSKTRISELKALIEQRRIQRAVAAGDLSGGGGDAEDAGDDPEEARCRAHIEREKGKYKDAFDQLRDHKKEIEHLHMLLEQSRLRLQRDFEQWMGLMQRQQQQQQQQGVATEPSGSSGGSIPPGQPSQTSTPRGPRQAWAPSPNTPASPTTSSIPTARPPIPSGAYAGVGGAAGSSGSSSSNFGVGANGASGFQPRVSGGSMGGMARASSNGSSMSSPSASVDYSAATGSRPAAASAAGAAALARAAAAPGPNTTGGAGGVRVAWGESPAQASPALPGSASGQSTAPSAGGQAAPPALDLKSVDPKVLEAARPYLTGNPEADQDIVRFYVAKQQLLAKLQASSGK